MCEKIKIMFIKSFPILLMSLILLMGCAGTTNNGNFNLPYEGTVSTDATALSITNNGNGHGIYSLTKGQNAIGIQGLAMGSKGWGVLGDAVSTADETNYGGYFRAWGRKGQGIHAVAMNTENVQSYGGYFETLGKSGIGVFALARSSENVVNYGGMFWAQGEHGRGVWGKTTGEFGWGVTGVAYGERGRAVYGEAYNDGDCENYGGYFISRGKYGRGIYVMGGLDGYAAEFRGNVQVKGRHSNDIVVEMGGLGGNVAEFCGNVQIKSRSSNEVVIELGEGLDIAEGFKINQEDDTSLIPGSVLIIDSDNPGFLTISKLPYDTRVAGIVTGANGLGSAITLGGEEFELQIALAGRVYCNVETFENAIYPGDLLTTSAIPGYAMRVESINSARGAILGKAMESLEKGKRAQILVLVTLQ